METGIWVTELSLSDPETDGAWMMRHASVENPFLPGRAVFTKSWREQPF
jgi:hypothetical protein